MDKKNIRAFLVDNKTQKADIISRLKENIRIYVCKKEEECLDIINDVKTFFCDTYFYPVKDIFYMNADVASEEVVADRLKVLEVLAKNKESIIITTVEALLENMNSISNVLLNEVTLQLGDEYELEELTKKLIDNGYQRTDKIYGKGEISVRGSILDIFDFTRENPIRIEFFDDEIDSIREFDVETQRSIESLDKCTVFIADDVETEDNTLLKYLENMDGKLVMEEPDFLLEQAENIIEDAKRRDKKLAYNFAEFKEAIYKNKVLFFTSFDTIKSIENIKIEKIYAKTLPKYNGDINKMLKDIKAWLKDGYSIKVYSPSRTRARKLFNEMVLNGITTELNPSDLKKDIVGIYVKAISSSFTYEGRKEVCLSDVNIFKDYRERRHKKFKSDNTKEITAFSDIKEGDIVVHEKYGIGIYRGIENIKVNGIGKDHIKIEYKKGDILHVVATNFDAIQKYIGNKDVIALSDITSDRWSKNKERVARQAGKIAQELIKLYADRLQEKGYKFSPDNDMQRELEELFEYVETDDQIKALEEIKADMESEKIMDRLLCGDVGFGKTEVAIRAAFKAVLDSKQVAVLVPTTILASQHYKTFSDRMKEFPVRIEVLSRFVSPAKEKKIIGELKEGKIDILIGTHKLLNKKVIYKDLGLLIIDEEQRFGVKDKEKIKECKKNVDVLTLSATPIPRTLNMSMSGVRDLSILNEPPYDRKPIQTYVMRYDEEIIAKAIIKEINRDGQVYFLHNKIEDIAQVRNKIEQLVPNIRVVYIHSKMNKNDIEEIFNSFDQGEIDVLVSTTIIETGLDIPNVNTIIIDGADKMGMSTLYQLRGRVGRSHKKGYAFLLYDKNRKLSEIALNRLRTLREFSDLGSGVKISMKDMELRGIGNMLGEDQHGHIATVGYDLYCKILREEIAKLKGEERTESREIFIDLDINSYIDDKYIKNEKDKLEIYKKINFIKSKDDMEDIIDECIDRFGEIPKETLNLIEIGYIKARAKMVGINSIKEFKDEYIIKFEGVSEEVHEKLVAYIMDNKFFVKFSSGVENSIRINYKQIENIRKTNKMDVLKEFIFTL